MPRTIVRMLVVCLVIAGALPARAQTPVTGFLAVDDCTAILNAEDHSAITFGFKIPDLQTPPDTPASGYQVDLMYDERLIGGPNLVGASVSGPTYAYAPNWREPELVDDMLVALVLIEGELLMDSASIAASSGAMGAANFQELPAPDLVPLASGVEVRWSPLLEVTDEIVPSCSTAGQGLRGFIIGYNVYRHAGAAPPATEDIATNQHAGYADLTRLDFNVADPDGFSGSDLDAADNLRLINPDGLPDTGDETLVLTDCVPADGEYHYRLQPVVHGNLAFMDEFCDDWFGCTSSARLDMDGDTFAESVDIEEDGIIEFSDPSGHGLGLVYDGSMHVGATAQAMVVGGDCGTPLEDCDNGLDDDLDGLVDCADPDCAVDPACVDDEDCSDGEDNDGDGSIDCDDPDCAAAPECQTEDCGDGVDNDGDALVDCADPDCAGAPECAPGGCDLGPIEERLDEIDIALQALEAKADVHADVADDTDAWVQRWLIERALSDGACPAFGYLPSDRGGNLELVGEIVQEAIHAHAGISTNLRAAEELLELGHELAASEQYQSACGAYLCAYCKLTGCRPSESSTVPAPCVRDRRGGRRGHRP